MRATRAARTRVALRSSVLLLATASRLVAAQESTETRDATALRRGDVELVLRNRAFVIPERVQSGLTIQPTIGARWMIRDAVVLAIDAQTVDNSGPGRQGTFRASRTVPGGGSGNFLQEVGLESSVRLWRSPATTTRLTVSGAISRSVRSYFAYDSATGRSFSGNRREVVPTLAVEASHEGARGSASLSFVAVRLPSDNALYVRALPGETASFGTVVGPQLRATLPVGGVVAAWGRAFVPMSGNNTIARSDGRPARVPAYDGGFRLRLNPALDAELFVSNALGNTGALAFIPDREYLAIGTGLLVRPGRRFAAMDAESDDDRRSVGAVEVQPLALAALNTASLGRRRGVVRLRGGGQGLLASAGYAPVRALQLGAFLDYLRGTRDEGELGGTVRVNLVDQRSEFPLRTGITIAASRTNNPLINLLAGRWDELERLGLPKGGFNFGDENENEGRVYVVTAAAPVEKRVTSTTVLRVAPVVAYVQRRGVQLTGVAGGFDHALSPALSLAVESGAVAGKGNELTSTGRRRAVPYAVTLAWHPGTEGDAKPTFPVSIEAYVTNRAGDSPFHLLRVRAGGGVSGGVGLHLAVP